MTPTKLLIGQILIVFAIVLIGLSAATQWAAWRLAYQTELGAPILLVGHMPIYRPWAIFPWWFHFDAYAPRIFDKAGAIAGASGFLGCAAAIAGSLWRARQSRDVSTYGSARWAIRASKLRYYQDANFARRVLTAPVLGANGYVDRPAERPHPWTAVVEQSATIPPPADDGEASADGGLQQERHPGLAEEQVIAPADVEPRPEQAPGEDDDPAVEQRAMDRVRGLGAIARGYAIDEGTDHAHATELTR